MQKSKMGFMGFLYGFLLGAFVLFFVLDQKSPVPRVIVGSWFDNALETSALYRSGARFDEALTLVSHILDEELKEEDIERVLNKALSELDAYTSSVSEGELVKYSHSPSKMSWGLRTSVVEEGLRVEAVFGPSKGQFEPGDVITGVLGAPAAPGDMIQEVLASVLKSDDPFLVFYASRNGRPFEAEISGTDIIEPSAFDYGMKEGVVHVVVESFVEGVSEQVRDIINTHKNARGVVLDLRSNRGGLVREARNMLDDWLDAGAVPYAVSGRTVEEREHRVSSAQLWPSLRLAVLQNGHSASASEIVSGGLKYTKRARVFGWQSFGKGKMQRLLESGMGAGGWRVTYAQYTVGPGVVVEGVGIEPDVTERGEDPLSTPTRFGFDLVLDKARAWASGVTLAARP